MSLIPPYITNYSYYRNASGAIGNEELPDYNSWNCDEWVAFYKRLKGRFGKEHAVILWQEYWNNKPVSVFESKKVCSGKLDFRKYFSGQGIDFDNNFYSVKAKIPGLLNKYTNIFIAVGVVAAVGIGSLIIFNIVRTVRGTKQKVKYIEDNPQILRAVV